jgi:hypothetical protein
MAAGLAPRELSLAATSHISSEPAVTDRQGIGFGWLQNAWLLHARLKIHRGGIDTRSVATVVQVQKTRGPVH